MQSRFANLSRLSILMRKGGDLFYLPLLSRILVLLISYWLALKHPPRSPMESLSDDRKHALRRIESSFFGRTHADYRLKNKPMGKASIPYLLGSVAFSVNRHHFLLQAVYQFFPPHSLKHPFPNFPTTLQAVANGANPGSYFELYIEAFGKKNILARPAPLFDAGPLPT